MCEGSDGSSYIHRRVSARLGNGNSTGKETGGCSVEERLMLRDDSVPGVVARLQMRAREDWTTSDPKRKWALRFPQLVVRTR